MTELTSKLRVGQVLKVNTRASFAKCEYEVMSPVGKIVVLQVIAGKDGEDLKAERIMFEESLTNLNESYDIKRVPYSHRLTCPHCLRKLDVNDGCSETSDCGTFFTVGCPYCQKTYDVPMPTEEMLSIEAMSELVLDTYNFGSDDHEAEFFSHYHTVVGHGDSDAALEQSTGEAGELIEELGVVITNHIKAYIAKSKANLNPNKEDDDG